MQHAQSSLCSSKPARHAEKSARLIKLRMSSVAAYCCESKPLYRQLLQAAASGTFFHS